MSGFCSNVVYESKTGVFYMPVFECLNKIKNYEKGCLYR